MELGFLLLFGLLGLATLLGTLRVRWPSRRASGAVPAAEAEVHRFLCPKCLHFGLHRHACSGCGSPAAPGTETLQGRVDIKCKVCRQPLSRRGSGRRVGLLASCRRCGEVCDPGIYHERCVKLVGVLCEQDFREFREQAGPHWSFRPAYGVLDHGATLFYVLNLGAESAAAADPQHAHANLHALWFGSSLTEPLELGERLDRYLRSRPDSHALEQLRVLVGGDGARSAGANVLAARLPQAEYGVPAAALTGTLRGKRPHPHATGGLTLAVLREDDLAGLSGATDLDGRPILNRSGRGHSPRHGPIRVVCVDRDAERRNEPAPASHAGIRAVWIGNTPFRVDELEARIQFLFRSLGHADSRAEELTACMEHPAPHPAARALLESRFGRVEFGVPAAEFLAAGTEARGWILAAYAPVRTLAVLNATDGRVLSDAMDPEHRHDLGGGWICEATPVRMNYLLNLESPDRTPGSFFATPAPAEVEAVWIHLAAREPLALAEYLDRLDRIPGLGASEQNPVVMCFSQSDLSPPVRNVVEARAVRVRCGVSAEDFLNGRFGTPLAPREAAPATAEPERPEHTETGAET